MTDSEKKSQVEPLLKLINDMITVTDVRFVLHVLMHTLEHVMDAEGGLMLFKVKSNQNHKGGVACVGGHLEINDMIAMLELGKMELMLENKLGNRFDSFGEEHERPATTH